LNTGNESATPYGRYRKQRIYQKSKTELAHDTAAPLLGISKENEVEMMSSRPLHRHSQQTTHSVHPSVLMAKENVQTYIRILLSQKRKEALRFQQRG
jgi:hypothetical protein